MKSIIVVDDEPTVLAVVFMVLQREGYACIKAQNAIQASEIFEHEAGKIDAMVSDIRMPGMSGFELAAHIRKRDPLFPILLMSGYADTDKEESLGLLEQPKVRFLPKPFTPDQLVKGLQLLL